MDLWTQMMLGMRALERRRMRMARAATMRSKSWDFMVEEVAFHPRADLQDMERREDEVEAENRSLISEELKLGWIGDMTRRWEGDLQIPSMIPQNRAMSA